MREAGYYWGRIKDDWCIYYWHSEYNTWEEAWNNSDFDEIDERQIKRQR